MTKSERKLPPASHRHPMSGEKIWDEAAACACYDAGMMDSRAFELRDASEANIQALTRPDTLRLHLGEMTTQELRTAQAAVRFALSRVAAAEAGAGRMAALTEANAALEELFRQALAGRLPGDDLDENDEKFNIGQCAQALGISRAQAAIKALIGQGDSPATVPQSNPVEIDGIKTVESHQINSPEFEGIEPAGPNDGDITYEVWQGGMLAFTSMKSKEAGRRAVVLAHNGPVKVYTVLRCDWEGKSGGMVRAPAARGDKLSGNFGELAQGDALSAGQPDNCRSSEEVQADDGSIVVPAEATPAMLEAALFAEWAADPSDTDNYHAAVYRAMVARRPGRPMSAAEKGNKR